MSERRFSLNRIALLTLSSLLLVSIAAGWYMFSKNREKTVWKDSITEESLPNSLGELALANPQPQLFSEDLNVYYKPLPDDNNEAVSVRTYVIEDTDDSLGQPLIALVTPFFGSASSSNLLFLVERDGQYKVLLKYSPAFQSKTDSAAYSGPKLAPGIIVDSSSSYKTFTLPPATLEYGGVNLERLGHVQLAASRPGSFYGSAYYAPSFSGTTYRQLSDSVQGDAAILYEAAYQTDMVSSGIPVLQKYLLVYANHFAAFYQYYPSAVDDEQKMEITLQSMPAVSKRSYVIHCSRGSFSRNSVAVIPNWRIDDLRKVGEVSLTGDPIYIPSDLSSPLNAGFSEWLGKGEGEQSTEKDFVLFRDKLNRLIPFEDASKSSGQCP